MNNSKIIDGEELKGKIGAFTQYLIDKEKSNSTIEGYRRNVKRFICRNNSRNVRSGA